MTFVRLLIVLLAHGACRGVAVANDATVDADAAQVALELNRLASAGDACRVYLLIENRSERAFGSLETEFVTFDRDGRVAGRMAVELAPLDGGRTQVKLFDLPATRCDSLSRILVNGVSKCEADGAPHQRCDRLLETASRTGVELFK